MQLLSSLAPALALTLALANAQASAQAQTSPPMPVTASFSIISDLVAQVGGDRITLENLVPRDGDGHSYQPSAQDAKKLAQSRLVFISGLGFEGWLAKLAKSAGGKAKVIELSTGIKARQMAAEAGAAGETELDPHAWWNLQHSIRYVYNIRDALSQADPTNKNSYGNNATAYARELANLDVWAKNEIAKIPVRQRKIVTNHDALGYFAARYGLSIIGTVVPGGSTERAPSAKETAALIMLIRREKVRAIFTENVIGPKLASAIARESGAVIAPPLYTDALGPIGSSGDTFMKAFRSNVQTIVAALK
jgi:ABC-type Zn uptake system ZnuABC Zn-binding protein ZnuA